MAPPRWGRKPACAGRIGPAAAVEVPMRSAQRTLVKSQPELWQLVDQPERRHGLISALLGRAADEVEVTSRQPESRLSWRAAVADEIATIEVEFEKKGWGTHVEIAARVEPDHGGVADWLEAVLDELSAPERRPFRGIV
jgi:hypothetical protein